MNKAKIAAFTILTLITLSALASLNVPTVKASPAQEVRVDPVLTTWEDAGLGEEFEVDIRVTCEEIDGLEISLFFDTNVLNVTSLTEGPFMYTLGREVLVAALNWTESTALDPDKGQVSYVAVLVSSQTETGLLSGTGTVLTIKFLVTAESGSSVLKLEPAVIVGDERGTHFVHAQYLPGGTPNHLLIAPVLYDGYYGSPILFSVKKSKIPVGENVEFNGTLIGVSAATEVTLLYRREGETSWTTLAAVTTNASGYFEYVWEKPSAGKYQVKATATVGGTTGESVPLTVIVEAPALDIWLIVGVVVVVVVVIVLVYYFKVFRKRGAEKAAEAAEE